MPEPKRIDKHVEIDFKDLNPQPACLGDEPDGSFVSCVMVCDFPGYERLEDGRVYHKEYDQYLVDPDEIVFSRNVMAITFDYPLAQPCTLSFDNDGPWTRYDLFRAIYEGYKRIYDEENRDVGKETDMIPGMLNRQRSNGRHGIWGHIMGDLYLEVVIIDTNIQSREPTLLGMGS